MFLVNGYAIIVLTICILKKKQMWCVPTTSVQKCNTCPSGYSLKDNKCIKTESVNCTTN